MSENLSKNYLLMHKDIRVAKIQIQEETSTVLGIIEIFNEAHLPLSAQDKNVPSLNNWLQGRSIPVSRPKLKVALKKMNLTSEKFLISKCMG